MNQKISFIGSSLDASIQCVFPRIPQENFDSCILELCDVGFYDYVESDSDEALPTQQEVIDNWDEYGDVFADATRRVAFIDCESIYEQGIQPFFKKTSTIPPCKLIVSRFSQETRAQGVYIVEFGDFQFEIWSQAEYETVKNARLLAGDRAVQMMNVLLEREHLDQKLYYEFSGNDTQIVLLTDSMFSIIKKYGGINEKFAANV